MASVGSVYFDALLKLEKAEAQAKAFEKKVRKIAIEAQFKNLDPQKLAKQAASAAKAASATAKIQAQVELNEQQVREKVAKAAQTAQSAAKIEAKVAVNSAGFKKQVSTLGIAAGTAIGNALTSAMGVALNSLNKLTATSLGVVTSSVQAYSEVQATLNRVQAKTGKTVEETAAAMEKLNAKTLQVAGSSALSVADMAALSETAVQAGRSLEEITNLLEPVAQGSAALGRSGADLIGDLSIYMDSYQLASTDAEAILEKIAKTTLTANTNALELAEGLNYFKSSLPGLEGVNNQLAVQNILAKGGLVSTRAGTAATALFTQANKNASDVLKDFGVNIKDSQGNLRGEAEILTELALSYKNISAERGTAAAAALANANFGIQGARAVEVAAKQSEEQLTSAIANITKAGVDGVSVLGNLAETSLTGLAGARIQIENAVGAIQIQLGKALSEGLGVAGNILAGILSKVNANTEAFALLGEASKGFAEVLTSPEIQATLQNVYTLIAEFIGNALISLGELIDNLTAKIRANPEILEEIANKVIGIATFFKELAAIVGTSLSAIANVLFNLFDGIAQGLGLAKQDTSGILDLITLAGELIGGLAKPLGYITGLVAGLALQITSVFSKLGGGVNIGISGGEDNPFSGIVSAFDSLQNTISSVITKTEFFSGLTRQLGVLFDGIAAGLQSFLSSFLTNAAPGIENLIDGIKNALPGISALVQQIVTWLIDSAPIFQSLMNLLGTVLGNAVSLAAQLLGHAITIVGTISQIIADSDALDLVVKSLQLGVKFILDTLTFVSNAVSSIQGLLYDGILIAVNAIISTIGNVSNFIMSGWIAPLQAFYDLLFNTNTLGNNFLINVLGGFERKMVELEIAATQAIGNFLQDAGEKWNGFTAGISQWFESNILPIINDTIPSALSSFWAEEMRKWENTKQSIQEGLDSFISFFTETLPGAIANTWSGLLEGFEGVKQNVSGFFSGNILGFFTSTLPDASANFYAGEMARFDSTKEAITEWFTNELIPFFTTTLPNAYNTLIAEILIKVEETKTKVFEVFGNITNWAETTAREAFASLQSFVVEQFGLIWNTAEGYFNLAYTWITETLPGYIAQMISFANEQLQKLWAFVEDLYNRTRIWVTETLPSYVEQTISFANEQLQKLWAFVEDLYNRTRIWFTETLVGFINQLIAFATAQANKYWDFIQDIFNQIREWITTTLPGYIEQMISFATTQVNNLWDRVNRFYESIRTFLLDTLTGYLNTVRDNLFSLVQQALDRVNSFFNTIRTFVQETIPNLFNNLFGDLLGRINEIGSAIADKVHAPFEKLESGFENIKSAAEGLVSTIKGWGDQIASLVNRFPQFWNLFGSGSGSGGASDRLAYIAGDLQRMQGADTSRALSLAQKYYDDPVTGSNENIFTSAGFSEALLRVVKSAEGFYERAYYDPNLYGGKGGYSIGFGTYANSPTERIGVDEGNRRLLNELESARQQLLQRADQYGYNLTSSQVDAMISFVYNGGIGMFDQLTNYGTRSLDTISDKILLYNKSGTRELLGLTRRREIEQALFDAKPLVSGGTLVGGDGLNNYAYGVIPAQLYGSSRSSGARRHAGADLDISGSSAVIQAFESGKVIFSGVDPGGYDKFIDVLNDAGTHVTRYAEGVTNLVSVGDRVLQGQALQRGENPRTGVAHIEVRPIADYNRGKYGFQGTIDPIKYWESLGIFNYDASRRTLVPQVGSASGGASDALAFSTLKLSDAHDHAYHSLSELVPALGEANEAIHNHNMALGEATAQAHNHSHALGEAAHYANLSDRELGYKLADIQMGVGGSYLTTENSSLDLLASILGYVYHMDSDLHTISSFIARAEDLLEMLYEWAERIKRPLEEGYSAAKNQAKELFRRVGRPLGRVVESGDKKIYNGLGAIIREVVNLEGIIDPEVLRALGGVQGSIDPHLSSLVQQVQQAIDPEIIKHLTGVENSLDPALISVVDSLKSLISPELLTALTGGLADISTTQENTFGSLSNLPNTLGESALEILQLWMERSLQLLENIYASTTAYDVMQELVEKAIANQFNAFSVSTQQSMLPQIAGTVDTNFTNNLGTVSSTSTTTTGSNGSRPSVNVSVSGIQQGGETYVSVKQLENAIQQVLDYIESPDYIGNISVNTLETLRRSPSVRDNVLM